MKIPTSIGPPQISRHKKHEKSVTILHQNALDTRGFPILLKKVLDAMPIKFVSLLFTQTINYSLHTVVRSLRPKGSPSLALLRENLRRLETAPHTVEPHVAHSQDPHTSGIGLHGKSNPWRCT